LKEVLLYSEGYGHSGSKNPVSEIKEAGKLNTELEFNMVRRANKKKKQLFEYEGAGEPQKIPKRTLD
jgi:hypothetical protein